MKTITALCAAMAMLTNVWAAKDVDLSEFDGKYKGKGTVTVSGMTYPLTADAKFAVSKNGSTAKVVLDGIVTANGDFVPWDTTLKLKKKGKMTSSNLFGVSEGTAYAGSGKYKLPKSSKIDGSAQLTVGMTALKQDVTMEIKPKGKNKKSLKVKMTALVDGAPLFTYEMTLTGK